MAEHVPLDKEALEGLSTFNRNQISWSPQGLLEFRIERPTVETQMGVDSHAAEIHFQEELLKLNTLLDSLAIPDGYISMVSKNGKDCVVIEGERAAQIGRALRDEYGMNFPGSANIPAGPAKGA